MAEYQTFNYGSGVLYGAALLLDSIEPSTGPSTGGQPFVLRGSGLEDLALNDTFTDTGLDLTKWTDISTGSGSISTGSGHLSLSTGSTPNSIGGIQSANSFGSTQWEAALTIPSVTKIPEVEVTLFSFDLYVDATNYCALSIAQGLTPDDIRLQTSVVLDGTEIAFQEREWSTGLATLKILRWGTSVYFYANGSLLFSTRTFISDVAVIRFISDNSTASYDIINTTLRSAIFRPYAIFDNQVVHDLVVVSTKRARGITPPSIDDRDQLAAYKGNVNLTYVNSISTTKIDFYEYYYESSLTILDSEQFDMKLSIIGDPTIRTPQGVTKGL